MNKSKGDWSWLHDEFNTSRLAELLGVKRQLIDNWIRGRNDPDFLSTLKLATLVGSIEELERRAKVKLELNLPVGNQAFPPPNILTDRNYGYLLSVAEHLKYISRFRELHTQASAALKYVTGNDKVLTARLWFDVAYAQLMLGQPLDALESVYKARKWLPARKESILLADIHWFAGECLRVVGKLSEAYPQLYKAQQLYARLEAKPTYHESGPVWLQWDLGRYFAAYGRYDAALDHFEQMEKLAQNTWLAEAQVIAAWSRGDIAEMKSEFGSALASYLYAKELAVIIGDSFWQAAAQWRTAEVHRKLGQFSKAVAIAEDVRKSFEAIGNTRMIAKANCVLAACCLQIGEPNKAMDLYNSSVDVFTDSEDLPMEHSIFLALGLVDLVNESQRPTPDFRKPLNTFIELDANRTSLDDPYLVLYHNLAYAEALRLAGYTERALTGFSDVINTCSKYGYQLEKAHALTGIAATKLLVGEADRQSCHDALQLYRKVGSIWGQAQVLTTQVLLEYEMGGSSDHLIHQLASLRNDDAFSYENQLAEFLELYKSGQKNCQVLLFLQAV